MSVRKSLTLGYSPFGSDNNHIYPFDEIFKKKKNILTEGFAEVDCVVLWGGQDIHPSLYNEKKNRHSGAGSGPSNRDIFELKTITYCKANNIPLIGICRGAQMLCIGAGGRLIQHVGGHSYGDHNLVLHQIFKGSNHLKTNSVHHQMMYPYDVPHTMLAWTGDGQRSFVYEGDEFDSNKDMNQRKEPEIVYFPEIKGLAIQGHPEYISAPPLFVEYCLELVRDELGFSN